jgi:EpsD family peptidyl-prolyl cis-trans isomerase
MISPAATRIALLLALAGLSACTKPAPAGEVIATVNGEDVTGSQIEAEARALGMPLGGPHAVTTRNILLQRVIDQTMLAQRARARKLDQQPALMAERARQDQALLARAALTDGIETRAPVTDAEVATYIKANPLQFAQRQDLHLDQIRFSASDLDPGTITHAPRLDQVADVLRLANVAYERDDPVIDSATLPPDFAARLIALAGREPLVTTIQGTASFSVLLGSRPIARSPAVEASAARQAIRTARANAAADARVRQLREAARIVYQQGYAPN